MRISTELYARIQRSMPIACVDLLVTDPARRVLLLRRTNRPASGQWWFPGGRVLFRERRSAAARRKLREECGLNAKLHQELGTHDVFVEGTHAVTTVFHFTVKSAKVRLDKQSSTYEWREASRWLPEVRHALLRKILRQYETSG